MIFFVLIIVYAVLILINDGNRRSYKILGFGLLITILLGSLYTFYPYQELIYMVILVTAAITNQHIYWYAIEKGKIKPPSKMLVNIEPKHRLGPVKRASKRRR